ncbi:hypothetical protein AB0F85_29385 [Nocardia fluminea]|uniref:hypothetical protein n=1 Tax=Nocardia fluminea TaxID=134984 RepID=UPI0033DFD78E
MADVDPQAGRGDDLPSSLSGLERAGASVLGVGFGGAGAVAVFITENGAGTAALLILAAAMLLLAVQGTPLTRFGSETANLQFANKQGQQEARREISSELAERSAATNDPAQAEALAEAAQIALPSSAKAYEAQVGAALKRVFLDRDSGITSISSSLTDHRRTPTRRPDFAVELSNSQRIFIETVYQQPYVDAITLHRKTAQAIRFSPGNALVLVVMNAAGRNVLQAVTDGLSAEGLSPKQYAFVEWEGSEGDQALGDALQQLGAADTR